jgi:hypothetical protein
MLAVQGKQLQPLLLRTLKHRLLQGQHMHLLYASLQSFR